ncbi:MAG: VacJ family lipoprotein [Alphaproteobacteria bacterium]|nr:VacJ family lipoprotein [Alphaproteobacteria bacterium]
MKRSFKKSIVIAGMLSLSACAGTHELSGNSEVYDPFEGYNRGMMSVNNTLDEYVIEPAAKGYRYITTESIRESVKNFLDNLKQPLYFANNLLQADIGGAGLNLSRFVVNTTVGVAGLFDVATSYGVDNDKEDFGQTLATWGVGAGPYIVLPILGPSNARDTAGLGVTWNTDPVNIYADNTDRDGIVYTKAALEGLSLREENIETLSSLKETSIDFYSTMRSIYKQRRADAISDGSYEPEFPDEFDEEYES